MISMSDWYRQRMPVSSRSTCVSVKRSALPSARSSRNIRASPGLSSTRRMCVRAPFIPSSFSIHWKHDDAEPEIFDRLHYPDELIQIDRLRDIAVGVQVITLQHVLFILRGRQHDDWNAFQRLLGLDLSQYLTAVFSREI